MSLSHGYFHQLDATRAIAPHCQWDGFGESGFSICLLKQICAFSYKCKETFNMEKAACSRDVAIFGGHN